MIDYREILKKYMLRVLIAEGVTFADEDWRQSVKLTEENETELKKIEAEVIKEANET